MSVLALVWDLVTRSQLAGAGARSGVAVEFVDSIESLIAECAQARPRLVVVDLGHRELDIGQAVTGVKTAVPSARLVAFGPHVHRERLAAARAAGCDIVVSRGQFYAEMAAILSAP